MLTFTFLQASAKRGIFEEGYRASYKKRLQ